MSSAKRRHVASHQWGNFYQVRFLLNFIQWSEFENLVWKVAVIVSRPNLVTTIAGSSSLIYWGRVIHMLDMKQRQSIIGSDDGLSPGRHQPITCTSIGNFVNCTVRKKHRPNLNRKYYRENVFEHVCEMLVILSRLQSVNRLEYWSWNRTYRYINMCHLVGTPWDIMVLYAQC